MGNMQSWHLLQPMLGVFYGVNLLHLHLQGSFLSYSSHVFSMLPISRLSYVADNISFPCCQSLVLHMLPFTCLSHAFHMLQFTCLVHVSIFIVEDM